MLSTTVCASPRRLVNASKTRYVTGCKTPTFLFFCSLLTCLSGFGQAVPFSANGANSTPIPGAGHDYIGRLSETVDPSSGSVSISIPIPTRPGRGITFPLTYYFNQAPFYLTENLANSSNTIEYLPSFAPGPAWATWTETTSPYEVQGPPGGNTGGGPNMLWGLCGNANGFTFTGLDNVSHNLTLSAIAEPTNPGPFTQPSTTACSPGANGAGDGVVNAAFTSPPQTTNDIQGWTINGPSEAYNAAADYTVAQGYSVGPFTVSDQNGTTYFFSGVATEVNAQTWAAQAYMIEDRNGNELTTGTGCGPLYCDTLSQALGNGTNYSVASGPTINVQYTVPWQIVHDVDQGVTVGCDTSNVNNIVSGTVPGEVTVSLSSSGPSYQLYFGTQTDTTTHSPSNPYGLINEIAYPNGGWVQYTYPAQLSGWGQYTANTAQTLSAPWQMATFNGTLSGNSFPGCFYFYPTPQVITRTVSYNGSTVAETQTYQYQTSFPGGVGGAYDWTAKATQVTTNDAISGTAFYTTYNYGLPSASSVQFGTSAQAPVEQVVKHYAGSTTSTALLQSETKAWYDPFHIACDIQTFSNGSTGHFYTYDANYKQVSNDKEYDFGIIANPGSICANASSTSLVWSPPSNPTRETITTFPLAASPATPFMNNLGATIARPSSIVTNYLGAKIAETDFTYDQYGKYPLAQVTATNHDDSNFPSGNPSGALGIRGNPTTITKSCLGCTNLVSTYTYYDTGQVSSVTDPCGNASCSDVTGSSHNTSYSYNDNWASGSSSTNTNAYLTTMTDALGHSTQYTYNLSSGELASSTDQNSQPTTYTYSDPLLRLTDVVEPTKGHSNYAYVDGRNPTVTVTDPIGGITVSTRDGFGHQVKQQKTFSSGIIQEIDAAYNGMGQVQSVSNPYVSTTDSSFGSTQFLYDALGRKTLQLQPDNVTKTSTSGGTTTFTFSSSQQWSYAGNVVTFVDEAGKQWQRTTDGLGRLTRVLEPDSLQTTYTYDGLDNLVSVTQSGVSSDTPHLRTFSYDSLSRLLHSCNPEAKNSTSVCSSTGPWTTTYSYDLNGNVSSKTDARNISVGYKYDVLNRLLSKTSSGQLSSCYLYDSGIPNGKGRLANEWTTSSATCSTSLPSSGFYTLRSVTAYDPDGRIASEQQCTPGSCTTSSGPQIWYGYDLAGNTLCEANTAGVPAGTVLTVSSQGCLSGAVGTPSGLLFTSTFDAASHLSSMTSNWSALSSSPLYSLQSSPTYGYGPVGPLFWSLGSGLSAAQSYTNRMRVNNLSVTSSTP